MWLPLSLHDALPICLVCDECAAGGEIVGREQLADLRFHIARVGDVGLRVGKGKLDGLHDLVIVVRVLALFGQRQSVEHAECHQHRDAVAVGRDLADGVAAVVLRDGHSFTKFSSSSSNR